MVEELGTKETAKKTIPVQEGLFTLPDSTEGFHLVGCGCRFCGAISFPKKKRCIKCFRDGVDIVPLSPKGIVRTWTIIRMKPFGYKDKAPYILAEVELPEGPHVRTQLTGINLENPEVKIGDEVEAVIEKIYEDESGNDVICYKFKRV